MKSFVADYLELAIPLIGDTFVTIPHVTMFKNVYLESESRLGCAGYLAGAGHLLHIWQVLDIRPILESSGYIDYREISNIIVLSYLKCDKFKGDNGGEMGHWAIVCKMRTWTIGPEAVDILDNTSSRCPEDYSTSIQVSINLVTLSLDLGNIPNNKLMAKPTILIIDNTSFILQFYCHNEEG